MTVDRTWVRNIWHGVLKKAGNIQSWMHTVNIFLNQNV